MKKIVLVSHGLATGGTDRVALYLANGLADKAQVDLLHVVQASNASGIADLLDSRVARHWFLPKSHGRNPDFLRALWAAIRKLRRLAPDMVVATGNNNAWFTALIQAFNPNRGGKLFVKVTNPIQHARHAGLKGWIRRLRYGFIFSRCAAVLVLSEAERRVLAHDFPKVADRFRVVANPYVTEAMLALSDRRASREPGQPRRVLAMGRLFAQKNFALLLRSWAKVDRHGATLTVLGDGPDREALLALSQSLGLTDSVNFAGFQRDVVPYLEAADLLVVSSDYEGLPAVVLEAMAAGCPVVCTDSFPAARELVGAAPGCQLVPLRDETALATAIGEGLRAPHHQGQLQELARAYSIGAAVESHWQSLSAG